MHFWNSSQDTVNATRDLASDEEDQILELVKWILVLISDSVHHEKLLFTTVQSNNYVKIATIMLAIFVRLFGNLGKQFAI